MSGPAASVSRRQPLSSLLAGAMRALNRVTSFVPPPPSGKDGVQEKIVVVQVHPNGKDPSFTLALGEAVRDSLKDAGHQVRVTNLYQEQFQAALGGQEHRGFMTAFRDGQVAEDVKGHVDDLQWCSGLVLCYPTWWYSFPAILKGWLDRTLMPGVAFDLPNGVEKPHPKTGFISRLTNIRKVGMVTTFGNSFWNVRYVGDPGRRIVSRGLRPLFHPECTLLWKGLYDVEKCPPQDRSAFLEDVGRSFRDF
ncbi:NAD(P)H dehydrogenase (quinone) [Ectocarpus siliculosus]|uniref:NAD(P)H dehydrogenase (Quinone) n=1 Tax=Ectocarpus siliculosus TaxID=2880 RepID=D7FXF8_ECTSI|nr:NAD(P)H dehydrogenase (quinone) [Ectocarpus siliculosus]|eukprot:CBJ32295.1 NAD(P)H dehydrogenase (quinone) [Ectocarpus siliculosus]